jgi:CDP-diacylglycerol--serine O-phosphatidyltransferase
VFSGKRVGKRVAPEMVLLVFVLVVLFFAFLIAYPWWVLTIGTVVYLGCLPLGWWSYREYQRRDAAAQQPSAPAKPALPSEASPQPARQGERPPAPDRPLRLN